MLNDQLVAFTDRHEAIALFEHLRGRDPLKPWPLLPILTFLAPGGGGKSTLIEYLRVKYCCLPDGRAAVPYVYLDFTLRDAPKELLAILVTLRNQLQEQSDEQGRSLLFPRFDLGATIALSTPPDGKLPLLSKDEIQHTLSAGLPFFGSLGEMGTALGNIVPIIPPLLVGIKWAGQIPALQALLKRMELGSGWQWYRTHSTDVGLPAEASISDVLLRLHHLSMPGRSGKQGREYLVEYILPRAFLADLLDALDPPHSPRAWSKITNVVLFLDGFEDLLSTPAASNPGIHLLEMLTLSDHRKRGETDPFLLVLGSRQRLIDLTTVEQDPPFEQETVTQDETSVREVVRERYTKWYQHLPLRKRSLRLSDLYLPLWLHDFGRDDTQHYLLEIDRQEQTQLFADPALIQAVHRTTRGHPLYLALAAAAVLGAKDHGRELKPNEFEQAPVSPELAPGRKEETVGEYLLSLFLRQLPHQEQNELIFCAAPRALDANALRAALQLPSDIEAQERWRRYRRLTFTRAINEREIIFHPIVRALLLKRLTPSDIAQSDYHQTHTRLREHFKRRARNGDEQAHIEEAYHALALGNPEPAIGLAISAQRNNLSLWEPLLDAVSQAPTELMPIGTEHRAVKALDQARTYHYMQDAVTALVLYTWLLNVEKEPKEIAFLQVALGLAYRNLPGGDRQANVEAAMTCYQAALQVYTREAFPVQWAETQNKLGATYFFLPGGDRQANLEKAIDHLQAALQVHTREAFPFDWAGTQGNLARVYRELQTNDNQANLRKALACCEAALEVYTVEDYPLQWADTQNNLAITYCVLQEGGRQSNLKKAISHYQEALQVYTQETFPFEWADIQNNLGNTYRDISYEVAERDRNFYLAKAIACYQAALQVHTREAFPFEWARNLNNLGKTYCCLKNGDEQRNLERAISCYQAALQVYTREASPVGWAIVQANLGQAYSNLPTGDPQADLEKAIAHHQAALRVYTRETFPFDWAQMQRELGSIHYHLPGEDRRVNLEKAIAYFQAALQVLTPETSPLAWAETQRFLGEVYSQLPDGDRQANLENAIVCYEAILGVWTLEDFPFSRGSTLYNLGNCYRDLPGGDRQVNREKAISSYQAALQAWTFKDFPREWAMTQNALGFVLSSRIEQGSSKKQADLEEAIDHFQAALQVYTYENFPFHWAITQTYLGDVYSDLPEGDTQAHLQIAFAYYEEAVKFFKQEELPEYWAFALSRLGDVLKRLLAWPTGDQQGNLIAASECYEGAMQLYQVIHMDEPAQRMREKLEDVLKELESLEKS